MKKVMKNCKILLPIILTIISTIQAFGADLKWSNTGFYAEHSLENFSLTPEKQLVFPDIVDGVDHSFIIYDSSLSQIIFSKTFDDRIIAYTFSDDMKYLTIGLNLQWNVIPGKPNIYIFDINTNELVQTILDSSDGHYNLSYYLKFSPKMTFLLNASSSSDKSTIWDLKNNVKFMTLDSISIPYQRKYIDELKFSADEKYFLYINNRTSVLIDLINKQKINKFGKGIYLDFSVEKNLLFRQFDDNLDILDFKNGNVLKTIKFDYQTPFDYNHDYQVKYLPGKNLLILYYEPDLSFYDLNLDSIVYSYQTFLFDMFFSENEKYLVTIGDSVKFIDINNKEIISSFSYDKINFNLEPYEQHNLKDISPDEIIFLNDNEALAFYRMSWMGVCAHGLDDWDYFWDEIWNFKTGKFIRKVPQAHNSDIVNIEFSPDGRILASSGLDSAIMLWDVNSGKFISKFEALAFSMSFSPDLLHFAAYGNDHIPRIYNLTSGDIYRALPKQSSGICFISYTPSGKELVVADSNGKIIVYNTKSFSIDNEFQLPGKFACKIAFKNDTTWLAAYQSNKEIFVLDLIKNEIVFKTPSIEYFLLSKNGKILFDYFRDSNYDDANYRRIWDIENDQEIPVNGFEKLSILNLINTNDENKILINAVNKTSLPYTPEIYQLDLLTGNTTLIYNSITQCFFENMVLSPDNKYLAISSENAALNIISYPYYTNITEPILINKSTSAIFPNPASDFINLRFNLAKSTNVSIKIYDILGNPVAEFANEWCGEGWQNKQIDISKLQCGTYYCRLGLGEQVQNLRLIILK
jgi:WD40 repeat protein